MKILLDDVKLNLLLEQKKQFIGKTVVWDSLLSAVSFDICNLGFLYDFFIISGIVIKTIFVLLGLFFTGKVFLISIIVPKTPIHTKIFFRTSIG